MKTISRSQAISDLRRELLKFVDREHSLCQVAARRGLFCNGFGRWSTEELERKVPRSTCEPEPTREELEREANRRMLSLQDVRAGKLPCDADRTLLCAGWNEFYENELARFHREMLGEHVRVVPDHVLESPEWPTRPLPS